MRKVYKKGEKVKVRLFPYETERKKTVYVKGVILGKEFTLGEFIGFYGVQTSYGHCRLHYSKFVP